MLTVGSLFAGIGGFDLGFERTGGMRTAWFVERDPYRRAVLRKRWPGVPIYDDVCTVSAANVEPVDVLCGGFPCQDISLAGRGAGISGERSGLWSQFSRLIGELRPRWVVVENVPALRSRGLGTVLGEMAALGYDAEWDCLPASAFGAPHRRDRIWIVAYPGRDTVRQLAERDQRDRREVRAALGPDSVARDDGEQGPDPGEDPDADRRRREVERVAEPAGQQGASGSVTDRLRDERELEHAAGSGADVADSSRHLQGRAAAAGPERERARPGGQPSGAGCWVCEWAREHYLERGGDSGGLADWYAAFRAGHVCDVADAGGGGRERRPERERGDRPGGAGGAAVDTDAASTVRGEGGSVAEDGGRGERAGAVADPEVVGERAGLRAGQPGSLGRGRPGDGGRAHRDVPDPERAGSQGLGPDAGEAQVAEPRDGRCPDGLWIWHVDGAGRVVRESAPDWWTAEPDVGRVAHGIPARVDRLRALGDSLVPQVAEWIGSQIVSYEQGEAA